MIAAIRMAGNIGSHSLDDKNTQTSRTIPGLLAIAQSSGIPRRGPGATGSPGPGWPSGARAVMGAAALVAMLSGPAAPSDLVTIPAGPLLMGSEQGEPAERPVHRVTISAFSIGRREVTTVEFAAFVTATGHVTDPERTGVGWHWDGHWREVRGADWQHPRGPGSSLRELDQHPVVQASWNDASRYCAWRGQRLPTEAEWERAARGEGARIYPWGESPPRVDTNYRASYGADRCCRADGADGHLFTAPVGSFPSGRSPFGVDDMAGNVWEWVEDWFDPEYYRRSPAADPVNGTRTGRKVIRGGGWGNDPWGLRSTLRHANPPDIGLSMVGFRCAR